MMPSGAMTPIDPGSRSGGHLGDHAVEDAGAGRPGDLEPSRVLAHGYRRTESGGHPREEPRGILDHTGRHPEAAVEHLHMAAGFAQVRQRLLP